MRCFPLDFPAQALCQDFVNSLKQAEALDKNAFDAICKGLEEFGNNAEVRCACVC